MNESYSVGRAFSLGFSILFKNLVPFLLLTVLISAPEILYLWSETSKWGGEADLAALMDLQTFLVVLVFLAVGCGILLISTFSYGVVQELRGHHAGMGATLAKGFSRFFHVILVALLLGVILFVPLFLVGRVVAEMGAFGQFLGQMALAGIYATFFVAIPAAVMERPGIAGALSRSAQLTSGKRGAVFGMIVVVLGVKFLCGQILEGMMFDQEALMDDMDNMWGMLKNALWAAIILDILFSMFMAVLASVTYYLLRAEKEGTSADELAAVFE